MLVAIVCWAFTSQAQLTAPGRVMTLLTQYSNTTKQDSIFVFYGDFGSLIARHTTGNPATFKWYRYNPLISNPALRFEQFSQETGVSQSNQSNLTEGGYRVMITDNTDSTEVFTCWVFTDNITLNRIDIFNSCQFLELNPITTPSSYNVAYDRFAYHDLSRSNQPERNTYGQQYFANVTWQTSESRIELPSSSALKLVIENPAPLYKSTYSVTIQNPFGRTLTLSTPEISAIATKADNLIQVDERGVWNDFDANAEYEALLGLRLESKSLNCDSIYWRITTRKITPESIFDITVWRDSSLISQRHEAFPDKKVMVPGFYKVYHYSVNTLSGCIDSVVTDIKVDSSRISADAIPNVFSPNGDGKNDLFRFSDTDESIRSIRSFTIRIYSRSGKLVYTYSGNPSEWEGWDGRTNSGSDAAEGVYYYIIEARGWDDRRFARGPYKGFLHLFRGK